jgi:D-alanyl-lipoteichoic acid acyltransferase DltB (MBOAT superfamily)
MDFSGYTDMALGSACLFNIKLTQNFNSPYLATSAADFWRRWHISFSRWILDYIFKPLQMQWRNWKNWGTAIALIVTFMVSGIWHGASWGFVIWGGLHGFFLACSVFYKPYQKKLHKALGVDKTNLLKIWQILVTFNMVSFAWVFFRANSLKDAVYVISNMLNGLKGLRSGFLLSQGKSGLFIIVLNLSIYIFIFSRFSSPKAIAYSNSFIRWSLYYSLVLLLLIFHLSSTREFIYFKF